VPADGELRLTGFSLMNPNPTNPRYLDTGARSAAWNMAVDEVLLENCRAYLASGAPVGDTPFVFRLYAWSPAALTVGRNQSAGRDVFIERLSGEGVDLCRRLTGGRAVLHDREITYSITGAGAILGGSIEESYRRISDGLAAGLRRLGAPVEFAPPSGRAYVSQPSCFATSSVWELSIGGRKVAGSAQCREGGAVLQHGSILLRSPGERLASLLKVRASGDGPNGGGTSADHAVGLCEVLGREVSYDEASNALRAGIEEVFGPLAEEPLSEAERGRAEEIHVNRYGSSEWTLGHSSGVSS
jgi:lipoate-protein ligase A